jgi:predicted ATPase
LASLAGIVDRRRLVTIVGPGGVGKTTLAREVARRRATAHSGGLRVVELAAVTDPSAVADVVVTALGLTSDGGAPLAALGRAGFMDLVVLLDNCEHVLDAVCDVLHAMLPAEPSALRVVATSRELLGMPGEHAWPLAPLDCSEPDSPAQRFFSRQADAVRPGIVTRLDAKAITAIVRQLDGLPLAIELAAARVAALGIADLAEQIDASLGATLGGLARRGGEPRHRTLRAAIEWSERLLPDDAREALTQWTVFAGAVRRSDALAVLQVAPEVVDELARRSLLTVEIRAGRTYYGMLQTVRSAVGAASEATQRRHMEHFAAAAVEAAAGLQTAEEPAAHRRIVELIDELRLAHSRARGFDIETAVRMSTALHWFAVSRLNTDILGWAAKLEPLLLDSPGLHASVVSSMAYMHIIAEQLDSAHRLARSAIDDADDDQTRCRALEVLADCALFQGDLDAARDWSTELVTVARRVRDKYYEAVGLYTMVMSLAYGGQHDEAGRHRHEMNRRFGRGAVSPTMQSWMAYLQGETLLDADPVTASAAFDRAIELADAAGSTYAGGVARVSAVTLRSRTEAPRDVLPLYADVIERWLDAGSWSYLLTTMRNLVPTLTDLGEYAAAAQALGAVTRPEQTPTYGVESERLSVAEETLRAQLGAEDFARHHVVGRARDLAASGRAAVIAIRGLLGDSAVTLA